MADKKVKELNDADLDEVTGGVRMATKFSQVARSLFGNASNKTSSFGVLLLVLVLIVQVVHLQQIVKTTVLQLVEIMYLH